MHKKQPHKQFQQQQKKNLKRKHWFHHTGRLLGDDSVRCNKKCEAEI